jgi:DNA-binding PadR family transcriptional regulator
MMLEFAILGLLHESPLHGYELKKRLDTLLGRFRAFSYGSLYPCLARMESAGWIGKDATPPAAPALPGRRSRVVYKLTADGKERFQELLNETGPSAWEDETFGVHFAFFAHADADTRLRILEGRRSRLEEQREGLRQKLARARERLDAYTLELQRHGLESVEREVRWLNELIDGERSGGLAPKPKPATRRRRTTATPSAGDPAVTA